MKKSIILVCVGIFVFATSKGQQKECIPEDAIPICYRGHLYIKGMVDSVTGNYLFDTGAFNLYFDSTYYANSTFFHEESLIKARISGAGTGSQKVTLIKNTIQFHFANNTYTTSGVSIIQLKPIVGDFVDGILGIEYFNNEVLEINYEKEYIKLYPNIDSVDIQGWSRIGLIEKEKKLYVPLQVTVNDRIVISGKYMLDLGSGGSISLTSRVSNQYNLKKNIKNKASYFSKYGGIGGESTSCDFMARSVTLGNFTWNDVIMDFSEDRTGALASGEYQGLLGNGLLERFDVYIDFRNHNMYLKPNSKFHTPFKSSRLDFGFVDRSKTLQSWIVTGLYRFSNAEKAGLKIDDKIITVNGENVALLDYELQKTYFDTIEELELGVERNGNFIKITFRLEPVLKTSEILHE